MAGQTSGVLARPAPRFGGPVLPQLDALRGIAILAVFAQHLGDRFRPFLEDRVALAIPASLAPSVLTALHHAWWGVDLFFVLSGFSLALGYCRGFARQRAAGIAASSFYVRRALRILPGFFVAVLVMIAIHPEVVRRDGFGAALLVHLAVLQGYVIPGGIVFIGAAWSLTTEVHFYALLPLLARPLCDRARGGRARGFLVGLAICVAAWVVRAELHAAVLSPGVHTGLLEATQRRWIVSRLDQFVLGVLAAVIWTDISASPEQRTRASRIAPAGVAASLGLLLIAFRLEGELYLSPGGSWPYALMSIATATLVLSSALLPDGALRWIAPWPLRALGIISYGVFLYHQLALGLVGRWLGPESRSWSSLFWNGALSFFLSCAMGALSWIVVERPALRWYGAREEKTRP